MRWWRSVGPERNVPWGSSCAMVVGGGTTAWMEDERRRAMNITGSGICHARVRDLNTANGVRGVHLWRDGCHPDLHISL